MTKLHMESCAQIKYECEENSNNIQRCIIKCDLDITGYYIILYDLGPKDIWDILQKRRVCCCIEYSLGIQI
jgi:hypothetical protein